MAPAPRLPKQQRTGLPPAPKSFACEPLFLRVTPVTIFQLGRLTCVPSDSAPRHRGPREAPVSAALLPDRPYRVMRLIGWAGRIRNEPRPPLDLAPASSVRPRLGRSRRRGRRRSPHIPIRRLGTPRLSGRPLRRCPRWFRTRPWRRRKKESGQALAAENQRQRGGAKQEADDDDGYAPDAIRHAAGDRLGHHGEGELRPEDNRDLRVVEPDFFGVDRQESEKGAITEIHDGLNAGRDENRRRP